MPAIEGDVAVPRPGMLDLLGKAKWDAWNKQKGIDKPQAKRLYVSALVKVGNACSRQTSITDPSRF